jgi:hypothetical protein
VTCGWREVANLNGKTVAEVLKFMAGELNMALAAAR